MVNRPNPSADLTPLRQVLLRSVRRLREARLDESQLLCEWLISRVLNCPRLELYNRGDELPAPEQLRQIEEGLCRLAAGEPLQYVQEDAEFMGRVFYVDPRVLIPRPETEQLVEWIIEHPVLWTLNRPIVAEVGTGSGCIIVSLALAHRSGRYWAGDVSRDALDVAMENAVRHQVQDRVRFTQTNLLDGVADRSVDVVVSNPPYIRTSDWRCLSATVRDFEPKTALDAGTDGLDVLRPLVIDAARVLRLGGLLFLEIGDRQGATVLRLLAESGFQDVQLRQDLAGKDRMICAVLRA